MKPARTLLTAALLTAIACSPALARPPAEIIKDIEALQQPTYDASKRGDAEYTAEFRAKYTEYNQQKAQLIGELYEEDPGHDQLAELLPQRWQLLMRSEANTVREEAEAILAQPTAPDALRAEAAWAQANLTAMQSQYDLDTTMPAIERLMQVAPDDDRAVRLLTGVAGRVEDPALQLKLYERAIALFPDSKYNKYTPGKIKQAGAVGQPFELTFTDAVTGKEISLQRDLRGKVVVIDFWATWCGPCIADMPKMKKLYSEFSGRGVEFIGVSLDQAEDKGGLEKLLAYVEENDIPWPQYYQGAYWDGEFSKSWGINSIPALFVIDAQGRLHSTNARYELEEMIPELLSQRDSG